MRITSDTLIPIEKNFRVSAGPGAGKTYWLVNHLRNVQKHSRRLDSSRKIACITYTNIGVEAILKSLGTEFEQIEVSTIHSFLYKHILKPYCAFLADEYGLNAVAVSGHDDSFVHGKKVRHWLENHQEAHKLKHPFSVKQLLNTPLNYGSLRRWLEAITYKFDESGTLTITSDQSRSFYEDPNGETRLLSKQCVKVLETGLLEYKKLYWSQGIIDHDDVLFLSYQLIERHPFLLEVLRAKFPYFFIDEFQDSNPIQVDLVKKIGEKETVMGVIGDPAQSIYEFQGAKPQQLHELVLPELQEYTIAVNRRSTGNIVRVLRSIRKDIKQTAYRDVEGEKPRIIVGNAQWAHEIASELCENGMLQALYRTNLEANAMKERFEYIKSSSKLMSLFRDADKSGRRKVVLACVNAVELARAKQYDKAIRRLAFTTPDVSDPPEQRRKAFALLYILLRDYDSYYNEPLLTFYNLACQHVQVKLSSFRTNSKPKKFYEENTYCDLAICLDDSDSASQHTTIHKAKGNEFENVLLVLEQEVFLDFLLKSNLANNEEHRIYYVAVSRAKERLFISVPDLTSEYYNALEDSFDIISAD